MKYVTKQAEVEAMQYTVDTPLEDLKAFLSPKFEYVTITPMYISTTDALFPATIDTNIGSWSIKLGDFIVFNGKVITVMSESEFKDAYNLLPETNTSESPYVAGYKVSMIVNDESVIGEISREHKGSYVVLYSWNDVTTAAVINKDEFDKKYNAVDGRPVITHGETYK